MTKVTFDNFKKGHFNVMKDNKSIGTLEWKEFITPEMVVIDDEETYVNSCATIELGGTTEYIYSFNHLYDAKRCITSLILD